MADSEEAFLAFEAYDFDGDEVFQAGLRTLPSSGDAQQQQNQLLRAKAFYYARMVAPIDLDRYREWKAARGAATSEEPAAAAMTHGARDTPYSASFAEVVGMIMRGEEIPGIRHVPDVLSTEPPSVSTATAPPKPWEASQHAE